MNITIIKQLLLAILIPQGFSVPEKYLLALIFRVVNNTIICSYSDDVGRVFNASVDPVEWLDFVNTIRPWIEGQLGTVLFPVSEESMTIISDAAVTSTTYRAANFDNSQDKIVTL